MWDAIVSATLLFLGFIMGIVIFYFLLLYLLWKNS